MTTTCEALGDTLAAAADGSVILDADERAHVETCLRCQADTVKYRKVARALHHLRTEVMVPPPGLLDDVFARLDGGDARRAGFTTKRVAYLGGIAAATAAGAAGAILAARSRRVRVAS